MLSSTDLSLFDSPRTTTAQVGRIEPRGRHSIPSRSLFPSCPDQHLYIFVRTDVLSESTPRPVFVCATLSVFPLAELFSFRADYSSPGRIEADSCGVLGAYQDSTLEITVFLRSFFIV